MKRIAILQSNYIPWKGYFDIINSVDEFVIYDDVQFTRRDWRNRNIIKTKNGLKWLTIPVEVKGRYKQTIKETKVADKRWANKHWKTIKHNYSASPFFSNYCLKVEDSFTHAEDKDFLSDINLLFIKLINSMLGIDTVLSTSSDYHTSGDKTDRLISICRQAGANRYLTGPSAIEYIDQQRFEKKGIAVEWANYSDYPEYNQLYGPFEHYVSIIDLLFNTGKDAKFYLKSF